MNLHTHTIPNTPTILVIFGATGDLMTKKIAPALYKLFIANKLPKLFSILGSSRQDLSDDDFRNHVREILKSHGDHGNQKNESKNQESVENFLQHISFHKAEFSNPEDYKSLSEKLGQTDSQWKTCSNKLFYLAVPPSGYEELFNQLSSSGLTKACNDKDGWTRVIVEKPFGDDYQSAQKLDSKLSELFKEEQIYRIDHYLAKEMVENILIFRFANNLFENQWDNSGIESISITLDEDLGVENRGSFYDKVGALKDVGQNHVLQILSLLTMDNPLTLDADAIRTKRAEALDSLETLDVAQIQNSAYRAQYIGYQEIEGVESDSQTETYFKLNFSLTNKKWKDVKVTLSGGKKTGRTHKEALITFKHPNPCMCPDGQHIKNSVSMRFDDQNTISINFWSKKPGQEFEIEKKQLSFTYSEDTGNQYTSEYEHLLLDCITGNQMLFVSTPEVAAMWKFIDPIAEAWKNNITPLDKYHPGAHPE